ncbi:MAG TPA: hypothetical protein VMU87_18510 [Stellaceae bacterium]|nr:hypothetical protein [Stellaceae bacterium]
MRAWRIKARRHAGIGTLALLTAMLAGAAPAAAQAGAPIPLLPQQAQPPSIGNGAGAAPPPQSGAVTAAPLAPTDASWIGVLGEDQGAFPQTMWKGTPRALVAGLLPLLAPSTSPVLQDLTRRLLLSNAAAPDGQDAPDRPPLAEMRLGRLLALGDVAGAVAMMDQLPPDTSGDGLDRMKVKLSFAGADESSACNMVEKLIARDQSPWWQRALIACQALAGDGAKASLGQSLLREQKAPADPVFDALIDNLGGRPHRIDKLPDPSPLRLALLAAAKRPLPSEALAAAGPAALLAYATSEAPSLERRLPAAERAALFGALPPRRLGALYEQVMAKPGERTDALKDGKLPETAHSRAILYQVARSSAPAATRAAAITALLAEARKRDAFPFTARLLTAAVGELRPQDVSRDFAGDAARALMVDGENDAAAPWIAAAGSKELAALSALVIPPSGTADAAAVLHDGIAELVGRDARAAPAQADLLVTLLAAFDLPVGPADWGVLLAPPHVAKIPSAALWIDQQRAAAAKRIGETVLSTILLLQSGDRLSLEPVVLARAIAGLRAIGHEADARQLALEAAIDAGL